MIIRKIINEIIYKFFQHDIGRNAAAIAYYLVFALFPILIFISNLLGLLNLDIESIINGLTFILPRDIVKIIGDYLYYITSTANSGLLWFSLIFSIYFPMRVTKGVMDNVRIAYSLSKPSKNTKYLLHQLGYTFILFFTISLTLFLVIIGHSFLEYITDLSILSNKMNISKTLFVFWDYFRILIVGSTMFFALSTLYIMSQDKKQSIAEVFPGTITTLVVWVLVSVVFSAYVENFGRYSVIYGALGAVIILLIWLYLTAVILILGAELNVAIKKYKR